MLPIKLSGTPSNFCFKITYCAIKANLAFKISLFFFWLTEGKKNPSVATCLYYPG